MYEKDNTYKIYTKGNYFFLIDETNNIKYTGHNTDIEILPKRVGSEDFFIYNLENWSSSQKINIAQIKDEQGSFYNLESFNLFFTNNTGEQDASLAKDNTLRELTPRKSQFDEQITTSKKQIINLKSVYGLSSLRDIQKITGAATITNAGGEYKLTTTASGTDVAILESAERGRYYAGQDALAGLGVRLNTTPTGSQEARWGYYNDDNGFGFGVDATGIFIFYKNGAEEKVYQNNWNADKLDGTGSSNLNLDLSDGVIFHINFTWYGYGTIGYDVIYFNPITKIQTTQTVHRIKKQGSVSIENPNLPIRVEVNNGGTATAFDSLYLGGRQFSTYGDVSNSRRVTSERRLNLGGIGETEVPLVSFRRKLPFESVSVKVASLDINTDFDAIIEVRINPTLTGAVYTTPTNHTASETALEADKSATAVSGGEVIYAQLVTATGQGNSVRGSATLPLVEQDFIGLQPVTITIRQVAGTAGTATCIFRAAEEW